MTAYGYIFVDPERKHQLSVDRQQHLIEEYGRNIGHQVNNFYVEQSARVDTFLGDREEASHMLSVLRENDLIIVSGFDFVFNSAADGLRLIRMLEEKKVSLYPVDLDGDIVLKTERRLVISTGISTVVGRLLECFAEKEEKLRTTGGSPGVRQPLRKKGAYRGGPVGFGYRISSAGILEEDPEQQEVIRRIKQLRKSRKSYREIAKIVSDEHRAKFSHEGIRKILARQGRNAGR